MSWLIFALLTALLTAGSALIQKKTLLKAHAMEFSATLAVVNLLVSLPFLLVIDYSAIHFEALVILFFGAILGSVAFLLVAKSTRHMELSTSSPLLVIGPGITALFAFIFLGEALTGLQIGGISLLIVGSYVLETKRHHDLFEPIRQFKKSKYIHYILLALLFYAVCSLVDRYIMVRYEMDPLAYIVFVHIFLSIHFIIMMTLFHDGLKGVKTGLKTYGWWILLVSVFTVAYRLSQIVAVSMAYVGLVVAIKRMAALFVTIIGGELFHEKNLFRKAVACLIMVAGAFLIVI
ncbi:EamA family transporter [Candidatus Woesearchaeota archaeon]|jgi:drug/metabolite transporter (DMT)-like permease|nr:EamA family transporter [Candidatus Woesearchaeota archaeon]MBT3538231.1 EamA family transporter [Candidatus Woesearchaeota archaeon]MBT4696797.1 EamA family transporter [Candidatus Woesearchaeota archaeon]MBT4717248.1 EamA family transporter [Candidatus Woesearchaeota archaeon]MBT7105900.1 EamA family transporter [Candidatus Woesearchaeota archaeon]